MVNRKLIHGSAVALHHTRPQDNLVQIIHGLKNYISVLLLSVENLEIDPGHPLSHQHQTEHLESAIHEMNCLVEKLVVYSESKAAQKGRLFQKTYRSSTGAK